MNILKVSLEGDRDEIISTFSELASKSFDFWDNKQDDVYQAFANLCILQKDKKADQLFLSTED